MDDPRTQSNIDSVLEKIKTGQVHMKSRRYFVLKSVMLIVVAILTIITSALMVSFVLFSIKESGELFLLGFGERGLKVFILSLPWLTFLVEIILVVALKLLLDQFEFGYKKPFLSAVIIIALLSIGIGVFIDATPLHITLLHQAERGELPIIGEFYEGLSRPPNDRGVFRGTITAIEGNTISITYNDHDKDQDDSINSIIVPPNIDISNLRVGDIIYAAGTVSGHSLQAYGFRILSPGEEQ